jgi:hypothetical protein
MENSPVVMIDASTYQEGLASIAEVIAEKVKREGIKHLHGPADFQGDIFISIRQAKNTYNFLYWVHSDELRASSGWRDDYIFASAPLVRSLIDNLYNIALLLQDPPRNGRQFRASGLRKGLLYLDAEEKRYGGDPIWDVYIAESRQKMIHLLRLSGFTEQEVRDKKTYPNWPTLGAYIGQGPPGALKEFLDTFSYGPWKQYSAIAHGAPEGLHEIGSFLNRDGHRHEDRPQIDAAYPGMMSLHMMRAAILLLSIVTEVQATYGFKDSGARINERIIECWRKLLPAMEAKEIYEEHYAPLLRKKGMMH